MTGDLVVEQLGGTDVMLFDLGGQQSGDGRDIAGGAGVGADLADKIEGGG